MSRSHHRLPFGAELQPDRTTIFRLWAPDAKSVALVPADAAEFAPIELKPTAKGWYELKAPLGAGTRYRYRIDGEIDVPDPAARFVPEGVQGPSEVVDPTAFEWRTDEWSGMPWHRAVVYELHVGTFTPEGTYAAIVPRLQELADLGINTIELMPLATFPGRHGWGYDGVLPFAPHPTYGRPEELKQLIDSAHSVGIAVLLDVVYNHFGPQGNYLHRYASEFFTDRYQTPWGAAIDFESAAGRNVRSFFIQNALYWLNEYRFDGLRLDAVHAIRDASDEHFLAELAREIEAGPGRDRHVHLVLENHDNEVRRLHEMPTTRLSRAQWNDDFHHVAHVLLTSERDGYYENYADKTPVRLGRVLAEGFAYQGEPYGEQLEPRGEPSGGLPPTAFINFLQNHDQIGNRAFGERLAQLSTPEKVRAGLAVLLLSPPVPMLFMGDEYSASQPFLYFCDYEGELAAAITDGRRREFAQFKAFTASAARERIPDPNALDTLESSRLQWGEREAGDHFAVLTYVRELLRLRTEHVVPRITSIESGSARYEVEGALVRVRWTTRKPEGGREREVLQLEANLGDDIRKSDSSTRSQRLFSTVATRDVDFSPWEVRLSIYPA